MTPALLTRHATLRPKYCSALSQSLATSSSAVTLQGMKATLLLPYVSCSSFLQDSPRVCWQLGKTFFEMSSCPLFFYIRFSPMCFYFQFLCFAITVNWSTISHELKNTNCKFRIFMKKLSTCRTWNRLELYSSNKVPDLEYQDQDLLILLTLIILWPLQFR